MCANAVLTGDVAVSIIPIACWTRRGLQSTGPLRAFRSPVYQGGGRARRVEALASGERRLAADRATNIPGGVCQSDAGGDMAAVKHRLPTGAAFSGFTAVWLHGLDEAFRNPIEITMPAPSSVTTRAGIVVRRRALEAVDVVRIHELPVASVRRTLHDVAALLSLTESVVLADRALHLGRIKRDQLLLGNRLPRIAEFVEPLSESPMETRLRMLPVLAGLQRPQAQVPIRNRFFKVIARVDLYYPEARLGLDGI